MTAEEARARAKDCEDRANSTDDPTVRSLNQYLAEQWLILADKLQREGRVSQLKKKPRR
jgi:hypothetical protein